MLSRRLALACVCVLAAAAPALAQSTSSLADLIRAGNRKAALDRIRTGADVNEAQPDATRPIHWAVYKVDYELIGALIAKKATVDVVNEFGATPLAEAVKLADARIVKMLLDAGAGVEAANLDGQTALMLAIKTGELPIVEMLVSFGTRHSLSDAQQRHHRRRQGRRREAAQPNKWTPDASPGRPRNPTRAVSRGSPRS